MVTQAVLEQMHTLWQLDFFRGKSMVSHYGWSSWCWSEGTNQRPPGLSTLWASRALDFRKRVALFALVEAKLFTLGPGKAHTLATIIPVTHSILTLSRSRSLSLSPSHTHPVTHPVTLFTLVKSAVTRLLPDQYLSNSVIEKYHECIFITMGKL